MVQHRDDNLGEFCGTVAPSDLGEEARDAVLGEVTGELFCLGREGSTGSLGDLQLACMVIDIEVLYSLGGVGQNLVVSAVDVDSYIIHNR